MNLLVSTPPATNEETSSAVAAQRPARQALESIDHPRSSTKARKFIIPDMSEWNHSHIRSCGRHICGMPDQKHRRFRDHAHASVPTRTKAVRHHTRRRTILRPRRSDEQAPSPPAPADQEIVIDVLVVYTPDAAQGSGDIESEIALAVEETNGSYELSGISQRIQLVHAAEIAYEDECDDQGFDYQRLPFWSNPGIEYSGAPMGVPAGCPQPSDNHRALDNTAAVVAGFRGEGGSSPWTIAAQAEASGPGALSKGPRRPWSPALNFAVLLLAPLAFVILLGRRRSDGESSHRKNISFP